MHSRTTGRHAHRQAVRLLAAVTGAALALIPVSAALAAPGEGPTITPAGGSTVSGTITVEAAPTAVGDSVTELRIDDSPITATTDLGDAAFVFTVGTNSIEPRYKNHLIVNGTRIDLTEREYVAEQVRIPVPTELLVQGQNTVTFNAGSDTTACGTNYDDFVISDLQLELPLEGESADGSANNWSYAYGDGSCGTNTTLNLSVDLSFTVDAVPGTTTGLQAVVDTTALANGQHTITAVAASGATTSHTVTVNNDRDGAPALLPADGALLNGTQQFLASPTEDGDLPVELAIDGTPLSTVATLGSGTSELVFTVGSNSIEARYGNHLLVNGLRIDLTERDYVSETVRIPVPNDYLLTGENLIVLQTGTVTTSCGQNADDFDISAIQLATSHGTATGIDLQGTYKLGDGSCGSSTSRLLQAQLRFDVDAEARGLRAELDTATLADGEHKLTGRSASGATSTRTFTTDNTAPVIVRSTPADGQVLDESVILDIELDDANGIAGEPNHLLDGQPVELGTRLGQGLSAGAHELSVEVTDTLGNTATRTIQFTALNIPAEPSELQPANGTQDLEGDVELSAVVTSPDGGEVTATFYEATAAAPTAGWQGELEELPADGGLTGTALGATELAALGDDDGSSVDSPSTTGISYQRFDLPVASAAEAAGQQATWSGVVDPQRLVALRVWNATAGEWQQLDARRGTSDGETTLRGTIRAEHVDGDHVQLLVTGEDPFADDIATTVEDGFADPESYDFALAHLTDTQYLSEGAVEQETAEERAEWQQAYTDITQWIADNADARKIAYAAHTGDIIENYTNTNVTAEKLEQVKAEYEVASAAQRILEDAGVPNGVLAGNHDNGTGTDNGADALYNQYFGPERYEALSDGWQDAQYGGGWQEGDNLNHYDLFTAGGLDFVAVYVSYGITSEEVAWANEVLARYADRNAILLTHDYLQPSSEPDGRGTLLSEVDGSLLYQQVVSKNPNVSLVLSGHRHGVSIGVRTDAGQTGNHVVELLADYQFYEVTADELGLTATGGYDATDGLRFGASFFRLLQFDVDRSELVVDTYSPYLDNFRASEYDDEQRYDGREDDTTLPIQLSSRTTSFQTDSVALIGASSSIIGQVTVASGERASTVWTAPAEGTTHAWYVVASAADGGRTASEVQVFSTKDLPGSSPTPTVEPTATATPGPTATATPGPTATPAPTAGPTVPVPGQPGVIDPDGGADVVQPAGAQIVRFAERDRVGTAIEAALSTRNVWWQNEYAEQYGRTVILASAERYPDALAAATLADTIDAPVLLNPDGDGVDARVAAFLRDQDVTNVILASGTGVLTPVLQEELVDDGYSTYRIAGVNRYQTATVLAAAAITTGAYPDSGTANVFLADGTDFPDALAAGAAAAQHSGVVLLTEGASSLPEHTLEFLEGQVTQIDAPWFQGGFSLQSLQEVYTVGGNATAAAGRDDAGQALDSSYVTASVVGEDRYQTATLLAQRFFAATPAGSLDDAAAADRDLFAVASGETFADAVAAGAWAANVDGPLLLSQHAELNEHTAEYLLDEVEKEDTIAVFGGTGTISVQVTDEVKALFDF